MGDAQRWGALNGSFLSTSLAHWRLSRLRPIDRSPGARPARRRASGIVAFVPWQDDVCHTLTRLLLVTAGAHVTEIGSSA
jgi:hypothetical protein